MKHTWRTLNNILTKITEEEVWELLQQERKTSKRISILMRLHQRYCVLRLERERIVILQEAQAL
jgi:hypothetical protein